MARKEYYSYSRLEVFESCGFKYYLKYYLKMKAPWTDNVATAFGSAVHKCEEQIANCLKNKQPIDYPALKAEFTAKCIDIQKRFKEYNLPDGKTDKNYRDKAHDYLTHGIYRLENFIKEHPEYEVYGAEVPLRFELEGEQFTGSIDRVLHNTVNDTYLIQDIKTWAEEKDPKDLVTPLQFVIYVYAFIHQYGIPADKLSCEYDLPLCDTKQPAGTKGFLDRGLKKVSKLFEDIRAEKWESKATPLCYWCEYSATNPNAPEETKYLCPYFSHWKQPDKFKDWTVEHEWIGIKEHPQILEDYQKRVKDGKESRILL